MPRPATMTCLECCAWCRADFQSVLSISPADPRDNLCKGFAKRAKAVFNGNYSLAKTPRRKARGGSRRTLAGCVSALSIQRIRRERETINPGWACVSNPAIQRIRRGGPWPAGGMCVSNRAMQRIRWGGMGGVGMCVSNRAMQRIRREAGLARGVRAPAQCIPSSEKGQSYSQSAAGTKDPFRAAGAGRFRSFQGMSLMTSDCRRSGWGSHFMSFHVISVISFRGGCGEMMK
jgi:hypothetical protein